MLYNPFNFQSNDNWDTDGLYWYNEIYTKKPVWTSLNQFHGLQKTSPRWSGSVPTISGSVLDQLRFMVAHFGGKKPDWTRLANTKHLDAGWIHPSSSSCTLPAFIIPKANTNMLPHWAIYFQQLNENTITDSHPLPHIDNILNDCAKGKIWGMIDMTNSFFSNAHASWSHTSHGC